MNETCSEIPTFKTGQSIVSVWRTDVDEKTGRETTKQIHKGIVLQQTTRAVRVFDNRSRNQGGDVGPEQCEWFPIAGKRLWVETVEELEEPFPVPPLFR